jgi:hypothetical protein
MECALDHDWARSGKASWLSGSAAEPLPAVAWQEKTRCAAQTGHEKIKPVFAI